MKISFLFLLLSSGDDEGRKHLFREVPTEECSPLGTVKHPQWHRSTERGRIFLLDLFVLNGWVVADHQTRPPHAHNPAHAQPPGQLSVQLLLGVLSSLVTLHCSCKHDNLRQSRVILHPSHLFSRFPWWLRRQRSCLQCSRPTFKIPWRRAWQPTPGFLPGESHGQRSLAVYSPRGSQSRT